MFLPHTAWHPHEYSAPSPTDHHQFTRRPLIRSAFSSPIQRPASTYEDPTSAIARPQRPFSEYRPKSDTLEHVVRFQEPDVARMSEDTGSVANSDTSETTAGGGRRRRRRIPRTSTAYHLAHPAPTLATATQKQKILLQVRPKLLLQLQRLSSDSRPKPALDVLPSFVIVPRFSTKFPRIFRGKSELGANDVMIVKSEDYDAPADDTAEGQDSDDEGLASRDLVAVICQMRKADGGSQGCVEITLYNGSIWTGTPLNTGAYEITATDATTGVKTTARWVRKARPRNTGDESTAGPTEYKYTFSLIDPNSRRHPIMATITQSTLEIPDFYTSVSRSVRKHPPTSPIRANPSEPEFRPLNDDGARTSHAIDESTKMLIQVTGVWVALRQGWSPYFKYDDFAWCTATANPRTAAYGRVRSLSLTPEASRSGPYGSRSTSPESSQSTFGPIGKARRSYLHHPITGRGSPSGSPQLQQSTLPKRASSAGTAFMQRAVARRAGNPPSVVCSDSDGEAKSRAPAHAPTNGINDRPANHVSTPPLTLESSDTTPETPTKPHRRIQSAIYSSTKLKNRISIGEGFRKSTDTTSGKDVSDYTESHKTNRWKSFTGLFRRTGRRTNDSNDNGSAACLQ